LGLSAKLYEPHEILSLGRGGEEHAMLDKPNLLSYLAHMLVLVLTNLGHIAGWMCWGKTAEICKPYFYME